MIYLKNTNRFHLLTSSVKQHLKLSQYKHEKLSQYFVERSPPTDRYFIEQERLVG